MKHVVLLFVFGLLAIAAVLLAPASAALIGGDNRVIQATGTGSVTGTPDRAQISVGIETQNADVRVAQQDNAVRMNAVTKALIAAGIPQDALKTTSYTIYPVYDTSDSTKSSQIPTGYRVLNTLTVTLNDINQTGEIIDLAVANGANTVNSIQFMLSDDRAQALRTEALKEAVAGADADAKTVASALHVMLGSVQTADISQGYTPILYESYAPTAKADGVSTPISAGDITVTATVSVAYAIL